MKTFVLFLMALPALVFPFSVHAGVFGISPPVYETVAPRGETLNVSVELSRPNPDRDLHITVSVRDDAGGAVTLTDGERFRLPFGENKTKYHFQIDTDAIASDVLDAVVLFQNEEAMNGPGGAKVILGAAMKVRVEIGEPIAPAVVSEESSDQPSEGSFLQDQLDWLFLFLGGLSLFACVWLLILRRKDSWTTYAFAIAAAAFVASAVGWMFSTGRLSLGTFTDTTDTSFDVPSGSFFLLADPAGPDVFLNSNFGLSQEMEGDWTYVVTAANRVWVVPSTSEQTEAFSRRVFRFQETAIHPYDAELPGVVSAVVENSLGTYAVLSGEREDGTGAFWCLAEVFESMVLACEMLDQQIPTPIQAVSFSAAFPQMAYVSTADLVYRYDAWTDKAYVEESQSMASEERVQPLAPLEGSSVDSIMGFVRLDEKSFFVGGRTTYAPLENGIWLEKKKTGAGARLSLVNAQSGLRLELGQLQESQRLYWLQKGGFITNP